MSKFSTIIISTCFALGSVSALAQGSGGGAGGSGGGGGGLNGGSATSSGSSDGGTAGGSMPNGQSNVWREWGLQGLLFLTDPRPLP